jgi:hypothetical protein
MITGPLGAARRLRVRLGTNAHRLAKGLARPPSGLAWAGAEVGLTIVALQAG